MLSASILVVDDDPNSLFGICQILKDEGYQVVPAGNGKDALEKLKANGINMVITDEKMPDLTGMELLSEIKKMDPGIPVILITAYGSVSMAVDALKKGAFWWLSQRDHDAAVVLRAALGPDLV